jgi:hypothetical protein
MSGKLSRIKVPIVTSLSREVTGMPHQIFSQKQFTATVDPRSADDTGFRLVRRKHGDQL